ncbi:MAG: ribonuclease J [Oscillospiraceae bacterium]|nr:ribonuclease J [Oscillospiraceae bacterium]
MNNKNNDLAGVAYGQKLSGGSGKVNKGAAEKIKIAFLGGLNEVGKNMTLITYGNQMLLIDCGLSFPEADMLGVDLVIPDFSFIERNADKILGIVITHGHEDHIGGLPYLLKTLNIPVYSTKLTLGLIEGKLQEHKLLSKCELNEIKPRDIINLGPFNIEAIHVNHSIPDSLALSIKTPAGIIIHTGDFKIDSTPIDGDIIDLPRLGALGTQNVLCLLSDSTNAENPGYTESESKVGESFESLFTKAGTRRLIIASFASNIHRIQQVIRVAHKLGRKVALSGRSLENVVGISTDLGYLDIPDNLLINMDELNQYPDEKTVIITTGSQGEPMSALTRMAASDHRKVRIGPNDFVIISANPIPGNEKTVGRVINELMKLGAQVVYERMHEVHVSGHACQEELKLIIGMVKPKFFIPVHGEQKHLRRHAALAEAVGVEKKNILLVDNGAEVELSKSGARSINTVPAGRIFVDGYGVGDVGNAVLRDRKHLSEDGLVAISVAIDCGNNQLISVPEIVTRGFVYAKEYEELLDEAKDIAVDVIERFENSDYFDGNAIKNKLKDEIGNLMYERTKRRPMILPMIVEL